MIYEIWSQKVADNINHDHINQLPLYLNLNLRNQRLNLNQTRQSIGYQLWHNNVDPVPNKYAANCKKIKAENLQIYQIECL